MKTIRAILLAAAASLLLSFSAWADTLEMKDGRMLSGKYLAGTRASIRFQADGKIRLYRVPDVLALTFADVAATDTGARPSDRAPATSSAASSVPSSRDVMTIPAGTRLVVRMIDSINSETNKVGDKFHASLAEDIVLDGRTVARKGADVYGRLVKAIDAGTITGRSHLTLELTEIRINGQLHSLSSGDYEIAGESRTSDSAKKIGGGAAIGAVIGGIAGGGKGAAIGAGIGAGAGAAAQVLTKGEHVRVPSETVIEFRLEQPVTIRNIRSVG